MKVSAHIAADVLPKEAFMIRRAFEFSPKNLAALAAVEKNGPRPGNAGCDPDSRKVPRRDLQGLFAVGQHGWEETLQLGK